MQSSLKNEMKTTRQGLERRGEQLNQLSLQSERVSAKGNENLKNNMIVRLQTIKSRLPNKGFASRASWNETINELEDFLETNKTSAKDPDRQALLQHREIKEALTSIFLELKSYTTSKKNRVYFLPRKRKLYELATSAHIDLFTPISAQPLSPPADTLSDKVDTSFAPRLTGAPKEEASPALTFQQMSENAQADWASIDAYLNEEMATPSSTQNQEREQSKNPLQRCATSCYNCCVYCWHSNCFDDVSANHRQESYQRIPGKHD